VRKSLFEKVLEARVLGRSTHFDMASISKQGKAQLERQLHNILQQVLSCAVEEKKRDVRVGTKIILSWPPNLIYSSQKRKSQASKRGIF